MKCKQRVIIQQNSECIVQGILPKHTVIGLQGVCTSSKFMSKSGLVVARSVVTVHNTDCILVKILNPSDTSVTIHRGKVLADFVTLDGSFNILHVDCHEKYVGMNVNLCNNVEKVKSQPNEFVEEKKTCDDFNTFIPYFDFAQKNLSDVQCDMLKKSAYFVTKENPSLGFTSLVEHNSFETKCCFKTP